MRPRAPIRRPRTVLMDTLCWFLLAVFVILVSVEGHLAAMKDQQEEDKRPDVWATRLRHPKYNRESTHKSPPANRAIVLLFCLFLALFTLYLL